jgi:hypothetical protein
MGSQKNPVKVNAVNVTPPSLNEICKTGLPLDVDEAKKRPQPTFVDFGKDSYL